MRSESSLGLEGLLDLGKGLDVILSRENMKQGGLFREYFKRLTSLGY